MEKFYSSRLGKNVQQVNKIKARKLYGQNVEIFVLPSNMSFDNMWMGPMPLQKCRKLERDTFDDIIGEFEYYNCNNETGRYARYFVRCDDI